MAGEIKKQSQFPENSQAAIILPQPYIYFTLTAILKHKSYTYLTFLIILKHKCMFILH